MHKEVYYIRCIHTNKIIAGPESKNELQNMIDSTANRIRMERGNFSQPPYKVEMKMEIVQEEIITNMHANLIDEN